MLAQGGESVKSIEDGGEIMGCSWRYPYVSLWLHLNQANYSISFCTGELVWDYFGFAAVPDQLKENDTLCNAFTPGSLDFSLLGTRSY